MFPYIIIDLNSLFVVTLLDYYYHYCSTVVFEVALSKFCFHKLSPVLLNPENITSSSFQYYVLIYFKNILNLTSQLMLAKHDRHANIFLW